MRPRQNESRFSSEGPGQDPALASELDEPHPTRNYYLPGDREAHIERFVEHYNHRRYHENLKNLTPADVYFGRGQTILLQRERIKPSCNEKGSNATPSENVDCSTERKPLKLET